LQSQLVPSFPPVILDGRVALLIGHRTCDSYVAGSSLPEHHCAVAFDKLLTPVCLSPSNIIWYQPKGGDALQPTTVMTHWLPRDQHQLQLMRLTSSQLDYLVPK